MSPACRYRAEIVSAGRNLNCRPQALSVVRSLEQCSTRRDLFSGLRVAQASQTAGDWIPPNRLDKWSEAGVLSPQSEPDPRGQLNLLLPMPERRLVHFRWVPTANALHWLQLPAASNFLCHRPWEQHLAHRPKPASFVRLEYWR